MPDLRILSAHDLDKMEADLEALCCKAHLCDLYALWDTRSRLLLLKCPECPPGDRELLAVRVA